MPMKIIISADEYTDLVPEILAFLEDEELEGAYIGPQEGDELDWPDVTSQAVQQVQDGTSQEAIVICWTGTGASIAANKHKGIRAALCVDAETARGARKWNHANVLALSARLTSKAVVREILQAWFDEPFSNDEWNCKQIAKINLLDQK